MRERDAKFAHLVTWMKRNGSATKLLRCVPLETVAQVSTGLATGQALPLSLPKLPCSTSNQPYDHLVATRKIVHKGKERKKPEWNGTAHGATKQAKRARASTNKRTNQFDWAQGEGGGAGVEPNCPGPLVVGLASPRGRHVQVLRGERGEEQPRQESGKNGGHDEHGGAEDEGGRQRAGAGLEFLLAPTAQAPALVLPAPPAPALDAAPVGGAGAVGAVAAPAAATRPVSHHAAVNPHGCRGR